MSDSFTEVTNTSWFSRIKSALSGVLIGLGLVLAAIVALFWNEGRAVKTAISLTEGAGLVQTIDPTSLSKEYNGKLVHFTGKLSPSGAPNDVLFTGFKFARRYCSPIPEGRNVPVGTKIGIKTKKKARWRDRKNHRVFLCEKMV